MNMMDCVDITPLVNPIVSWAHIAPFQPQMAPHHESLVQTRSARSRENSFELFAKKSGALAPTSIVEIGADKIAQRQGTIARNTTATRALPRQQTSNSNDSEIDRIAKQRVRLFAAKYAGGTASTEILARLEILNERLLDRSPRVSADQVQALESANEKLVRIRAAREERAKRLGILA